jgi:hypothetical protein
MDMTMIASGTFTRSNLQLAFQEYIDVNGEAAAIKTLKEATGAENLADVPDAKIITGVAALVSTLTLNPAQSRITAKAGTRRAKSTLASIASRLDEIREKAFARGAT